MHWGYMYVVLALTHRYASLGPSELTHWGRVTHICVSKLTIIVSDNGLAPTRRQAIIWNNDGYLNQCWDFVNWTFGNKLQWNFNRNSHIFIQENPFENVVWKMASIFSRPQCVHTLWPGSLHMASDILVKIGWSNDLWPVWSSQYLNQLNFKFQAKYTHFLSRKYLWKCRLQNGGHFFRLQPCQNKERENGFV